MTTPQPTIPSVPLFSEGELALPPEFLDLGHEQTDIPQLAKDEGFLQLAQEHACAHPTRHYLLNGDARKLEGVQANSVHLIVTSPPYWTLKRYRDGEGQLGHINGYAEFLEALHQVWQRCFEVLVPGGRLVIVVGDVCLSRRENAGRHAVIPLHASILEDCRGIGFDNLAPIIWHKIANAKYEVDGGGGFLGKPYEPNGIIKNDIEFILMQRKPGGYRKPTRAQKLLSVISAEHHKQWFQQIWSGLTGASTKVHPAPYPLELAERLVRMFSFVGDTVLDPFMGTATTNLAAQRWGRNSLGFEIDPEYHQLAVQRFRNEARTLFQSVEVKTSYDG